MALLILLTQSSDNSLALDSYGVISTAAMFDQEVSVVYCGNGLNQLNDSVLVEQLQNCLEFGVKAVFACHPDLTEFDAIPCDITQIGPDGVTQLIQQSSSILSF